MRVGIKLLCLAALIFTAASTYAQVTDAVLGEIQGSAALDQNDDNLLDAADILLEAETQISSDAKIAVLEDAITTFEGLGELSRDEQNLQLAAWFRDQPAIGDAGVTDGENVWAVYTDDTPLVFVNNRPASQMEIEDTWTASASTRRIPRPEPESGAPAMESASPQQIPPEVFEEFQRTQIPHSNRAAVLKTLGTGFTSADITARITDFLVDAGYDVNSSDGSVEALKNLPSDLGVFFIEGHFSRVDGTKEIVDNDLDVFCFSTTTPLSRENLLAYNSDIRAGRLVPMVVATSIDSNGNENETMRLGFTGDFVREYLDFSQQSLAAILACNSDRRNFKSAFIEKGAGCYLGWNDVVRDYEGAVAMLHMFGRMTSPVFASNPYMAPWDNSMVRPFPIQAIYREMENHVDTQTDPLSGQTFSHPLHQDRDGTTLIMSWSDQSFFGTVRPFIRTITVSHDDEEFILHGIFGIDPTGEQKAFVNNREVTINSWQTREIRIEAPKTGDTSAGPVFVSLNGISSNTVNVSAYSSTLDFSLIDDGTGQVASGSVDFRFRYDVRPYRLRPDEEPDYAEAHALALGQGQSPEELLLALIIGGDTTAASISAQGNVNTGGALSYSWGGAFEAIGCDETGSVSGGGSLPPVPFDEFSVINEQQAHLMSASLIPIEGPTRFVWAFAVKNAMGDISDGCDNNIEEVGLPNIGSGEDGSDWILEDDFSIAGGSFTDTDFNVPASRNDGSLEMNWQAMSPQFPPDPMNGW